jgi:hypothetical protein
MKRLTIMAVMAMAPAFALTPASSQISTWSQSFVLPGGETETREFAQYMPHTTNAELFVSDGYLGYGGTLTSTPESIWKLNQPLSQGGAWSIEITFSSMCSALGLTPNCYNSYISALRPIAFTLDANGFAVNTTIISANPLLSRNNGKAGCAPTVGPTFTFSKNNTDGAWYADKLTCDTGNQIRSYSWVAHTDNAITSPPIQQYAFAGEDTGVFAGQLNPNQGVAQHPIIWSTTPEFLASSYPSADPQCSVPRIMAFAEAIGQDGVSRAYLSLCYDVFVRVDGPQSTCIAQQVMVNGNCVARWQKYWLAQAINPGNVNGLRGLTAINEANPQFLLTGYEGNTTANAATDQNYWNIPPLCPSSSPACSGARTCADYSSTTGLVTVTNAACATSELRWGGGAGSVAAMTGLKLKQTVSSYNTFSLHYDANGNPLRLSPFSMHVIGTPPIYNGVPTSLLLANASGIQKIAEGSYLSRDPSGTWTLVFMPDIFSTPQNGFRTIIDSPFDSECTWDGTHWINCAIYAGGFDGGDFAKAPRKSYFWCLPDGSQCPANPAFVPVQNTAVVARFGP